MIYFPIGICGGIEVCFVFMYLLILVLSRVVLAEPLGQRFVLKRSGDSVLHLDLSQGVGGWHQLHHAWKTHHSFTKHTASIQKTVVYITF